MNTEEIQEKVAEVLYGTIVLNVSDSADARECITEMTSLVCRLVSQAYEEAARLVEDENGFQWEYVQDEDNPNHCYTDGLATLPEIAKAIRALKDSLQEKVPS